jgi:CarD family transcriptional regulator, regulator of rRNA transcription
LEDKAENLSPALTYPPGMAYYHRDYSSSKLLRNFKMRFKIGDKIIYPNQGVGTIEDIAFKNLGGSTNTEFYIVRLNDSESNVMIPIANAESVGLRSLSNEKVVGELYSILKTKEDSPSSDWKARYKSNSERMSTGDIREVTTVMKDLFFLNQHKDLSFREKKMLERAMQLVVSEIAIVEDFTFEEVGEKLEAILLDTYKQSNPA